PGDCWWPRVLGAAVVIGAAWTAAADASATEGHPLEPVRFYFEAPESCVTGEQFVGRVLDQSPGVRVASDEELARTFRISMAKLGDVTAGVAAARTAKGDLSLSAQGRCADVAEALANFVIKSLGHGADRDARERLLSDSNPYILWNGTTAPPLPGNPYLEHRGDSLRPAPDRRSPLRPLQNRNPYTR